jgi:hypothetical protein
MFGVSPALAQDASDRALLATFCDAGNIKGASCKRARGYPNAPKRGCEVTLTGDRQRGRFIATGNPLLVAPYESPCESHATDDGGVAMFELAEGKYLFRGFQPGMQGTCITVPKDTDQDWLACLTGHIGQGILESGLALINFAARAKGIAMSFDFLLRAEDSIGAWGANTVECKEKPPKYFELDKLKAGPRPMTVSLEAAWADVETVRTACGKGFPKPEDATRDPPPGAAFVPEDRIRRGKIVVDLATRKVTTQ